MPYPRTLAEQPTEPTWREAASLIILASTTTTTADEGPNLRPDPFDYRLLMVKRSGGSSFMASAFVFPGGQVELSDFDPAWLPLFERLGCPRERLDQLTSMVVGPRPPLVTDSITLRNARKQDPSRQFIHSDIGLRISAIRETFEEAGKNRLTTA